MKVFLQKTLALFLCLAVMTGVLGCSRATGTKLEDVYEIASAYNGSVDVTDDFDLFQVTFRADGTVDVAISYLGIMESRKSSTYSVKGSTVKEKTTHGETFTYKLSGDTLTTTYVDSFDGAKITVTLNRVIDDAQREVDFEGVLFGTDVSESKFFNYCPAIITEIEDGQEVMHVWFCTNKDDGLIKDHIGYRKGVKQPSGKWIFSDLQIVMAPTDGTWDARHTCDPAVIKGEFKYQNTTYTYLMAYLGCITEDYSNNETGIAVANSPTGPWIKVDTLNPIVPWADECRDGTWGTGMPSLISIDQKGEVLLTYQSSVRGTGIQRWDFTNLDNPELKAQYNVSLKNDGIRNYSGAACAVRITDFAYDPAAKRLYVFGVTNDKNPADVTKTHVNSHCVLAYVDGMDDMEEVSATLQSGNYSWTVVGYVGPQQTGWNRNHNPGIVRDIYGYIPDPTKIGVIVSTGHNDWGYENIFTYRLHGYTFDITLS